MICTVKDILQSRTHDVKTPYICTVPTICTVRTILGNLEVAFYEAHRGTISRYNEATYAVNQRKTQSTGKVRASRSNNGKELYVENVVLLCDIIFRHDFVVGTKLIKVCGYRSQKTQKIRLR